MNRLAAAVAQQPCARRDLTRANIRGLRQAASADLLRGELRSLLRQHGAPSYYRLSSSTPPVANAFSACSFRFQPGIKSLPPSYTSRTTASIAAPLSISTLRVSSTPYTPSSRRTEYRLILER